MANMNQGASETVVSSAGGWRLDHSYRELPLEFFSDVEPTPVAEPRRVLFNHALAESLGLLPGHDELEAAVMVGNRLPPGARPLAQAYAGHQYGHFTVLGDGRAILLGEQITPKGDRFDLQLKGAGPTPYSRRGDGRAALGPMLREYVISEAMAALTIPTTRSLAVTATGETVWRTQGQLGAVLLRVASSHLRVGTFQWAALQRNEAHLAQLVDYALRRHFPDRLSSPSPALVLLESVIQSQADLLAQWMRVGFVHGVMNTDNMAISGETIDYGPCAFLDTYDPETVFSSIDHHGRYAFGQQPRIAQWNLARLAETLLPLLATVEDQAIELATDRVKGFTRLFQEAWLSQMRKKLGLFNEESGDAELIERLLTWMHEVKADYTFTFATLAGAGDPGVWRADARFATWEEDWRRRLSGQTQGEAESLSLRQSSCPIVIPRNHRVEAALRSAEEGDLSALHRLVDMVSSPYAYSSYSKSDILPPESPQDGYQTFCGT
ncbi:MAG TPA: YdiU family protein [Opitutaceae bacterium]|nr:YdiU family protein [Opitutaceae bacterium]